MGTFPLGCGPLFLLFGGAKFLVLPQRRFFRTLKGMEVHFTPEQEAQLSQIATHAGTDAERLVKDAALGLLQEEGRFHAAVREGIAQANRGEFIEEEEMDARLAADVARRKKCISAGHQPPQRTCRA